MLLLIGSAIDNADRWRQFQIRHSFLNCRYACTEIDALQACGHLNVALLIFPQDFGLTREFGDVGQRSERRRLSIGIDQHRIAHRLERGPAGIRISHAHRVRTLAENDGRRCGLAFNDCGADHPKIVHTKTGTRSLDGLYVKDDGRTTG